MSRAAEGILAPAIAPEARNPGFSNENPAGIGLLALIGEDLRNHGGSVWTPGFWAVAVHRFGNWRMGVRPKLLRAPLSIAYRAAYYVVTLVAGIELPYTIRLGRRVRIWHHGGIVLSAVSIGDDVQIRQNTTMGLASIDRPEEIPRIGHRVDIGCGACILGPVSVGDDSKIGANAVVIADIPAGSTAVGIPARVVRRGVPTMIPDDVGVVAIGRNEGGRLGGCLASLVGRDHVAALVYVDSGSTDGSVALARSMGVEVVELDMSRTFSAARARNEGFGLLKRIAPGLRFVMFVDGDCEVVDGWITRARAELEARPDAAVVCGRRREKAPEATVFNRLADLEWDTPIGEALACGGDSVMRAEAFEQVGGFDPTCTAGEEPQLCTRLRKAGWTIWRVDAEMTRHDLDMTTSRQWWKRHYRSGYAGLDVTTRFPGEPRLFVRELKRARTWGAALPAAALATGAVAGLVAGPMAALGVVGVAALAYPLQVARLARQVRPRVVDGRTALAYGYHTTIAKWANLAGQIGYLRDRRRGRTARLIEYKAPEPAEAAR